MSLDERSLAKGLRVGVGVGPAEGLRPGGAGEHQLLANPFVAKLLGADGDDVAAGRAQLSPSALGQLILDGRAPRLCLEVAAESLRRVDLGPPVDVDVEAMRSQQVLLGLTLEGAGHVAGRDGDEMLRARSTGDGGDAARFGHGVSHSRGAQQVDLHGLIERGVEGHRRGRVDDDVAAREQLEALLVEAEQIARDVAWHRTEPAGDLLVEGLAELLAQAIEAVVSDDLLHRTVEGRGPPPGADEEHHL